MSQITQDPFHKYTSVIRDLTGVAADISRVEETKAAAASNRQHQLLDGCIQEEQALLLKLRGLEQHRMQQQKALGWEDLTLRQILERASQEQRTVLAPLFESLEQQLNRLSQARDASEKILGVRLHELELLAMRQQGSSYNSEGSASPAGSSARIRDTYV